MQVQYLLSVIVSANYVNYLEKAESKYIYWGTELHYLGLLILLLYYQAHHDSTVNIMDDHNCLLSSSFKGG